MGVEWTRRIAARVRREAALRPIPRDCLDWPCGCRGDVDMARDPATGDLLLTRRAGR